MVSAEPGSHRRVKLGRYGKLKEREKQLRWGRWPLWRVSWGGGGRMCWSPWAFGFVQEENRHVCCSKWMSLASFPQRESGRRPHAYPWRNCPNLCANLGLAAGAWWERKNIPPTPFPSHVKSRLTWIEIQTNNTRSVNEGRLNFLSIHHLKSPSFSSKVRFGAGGPQHHAPVGEPREKRQGRTQWGARKTSKCDCAVECCSPRFPITLGITTLF